MTRYTVLCDEEVTRSFVDKWLAADELLRMTLTGAANWVDKNLTESPEGHGLYWPDENIRVAEVTLAISAARVSVGFEIVPNDRIVRVVRLTVRL